MYNREFKEIKKHLAFGMMRLPMKDDKIDNEQVCRMVDLFLEKGFNYFDTAHGYHDGLSEIAVKECLTSRHDRSEYILTDKLTDAYFKTEEDIRPLIDSQLEACGVDYFDFLLMHAQNAKNFEFFKQCRAYETAFDLKAEGKVRHVGLSFHDKATVLDRILTEYPEVEIVQIQFNYLDYEDVSIESRKVYEVCRKHGKPVLVMEPVRGGNLVNLPEEAQKALDDLDTLGYVQYKKRICRNVHLNEDTLRSVTARYLGTIINRMVYTYGNSIMEKFINMMIIEYHLSNAQIHRFLFQPNISQKYQLIDKLNGIRKKVSHDTDDRFTTKDYEYYMANVYDLINSLLEVYRED